MTTIFKNQTKFAIWAIPTEVVNSAAEVEIGPGRQYSLESLGNTQPYAPYSEIRLVEHFTEEGKRVFKVEADRRQDFEEPKDAGLSLVLINDDMSNPRSYPSYREGFWMVNAPAGIEIVLHGIDTALKVSEAMALNYVPVTMKKVFDSSRLDGYRMSAEGGYFQVVPRTQEEILKIKNARKKAQLESSLGITMSTKEPE